MFGTWGSLCRLREDAHYAPLLPIWLLAGVFSIHNLRCVASFVPFAPSRVSRRLAIQSFALCPACLHAFRRQTIWKGSVKRGIPVSTLLLIELAGVRTIRLECEIRKVCDARGAASKSTGPGVDDIQPSNRRAITCACISAAPSKMFRIRESQRIRLIPYSSANPLPP